MKRCFFAHAGSVFPETDANGNSKLTISCCIFVRQGRGKQNLVERVLIVVFLMISNVVAFSIKPVFDRIEKPCKSK